MGFYSDRIFPILLKRAVRHFADDRAEIVSQATGTVLEIGIGGGENLAHYSAAATRIVGIEPSPSLLRHAIMGRPSASEEEHDQEQDRDRFTFQVGSAESLPFRDHSFDTAVAFLVFCTILERRLVRMQSEPGHPGRVRWGGLLLRVDRRGQQERIEKTEAAPDQGCGGAAGVKGLSTSRPQVA